MSLEAATRPGPRWSSLSTATSKYDKPYFNLHVDLVRFNSQGKIAQLRQFFDTRHLHDHVEEHHGKSKEGEGK